MSIKQLEIAQSGNFQTILAATGATLIVSVYQAGKLILISSTEEGKLKITPVTYPKPMGISIRDKQLGIATKRELHIYKDNAEVSKQIKIGDKNFDKLFFPRVTYHTGALDLHDVSFIKDEIWAVNTLYSCICSFDAHYNFTPRWQPHFVDEITPEDRCHLNGMAVENDEPSFVTALGSGNSAQSWRSDIAAGGVLMSIPENKIVVDGLAMPHSPKIHEGYIYLLESAKGQLVRIDRKTWTKETVCQLNGLVRGLTLVNNTAFVGISKVREKSTTFSKLDERVKADTASIYAIDLSTGMILGALQFKNIIQEIYDIHCFENTRNVGIFGTYDERQYTAVSTPDRVFWRRMKSKETKN